MWNFRTIWRKIVSLFGARAPSAKEIISNEKAVLAKNIVVSEIYVKLQETNDADEKSELIKKIAQHETAKYIIEYAGSETQSNAEKKSGRKIRLSFRRNIRVEENK